MSDFNDLPDGVASLLESYVDSCTSLELVVAAAREPARSWSAAQVSSDLGVASRSAQRELDRLVRLGLMTVDPAEPTQYRLEPEDDAKAAAVREIERCYRTHRVAIINHVASRAINRIQTLANAFRLGGTKT